MQTSGRSIYSMRAANATKPGHSRHSMIEAYHLCGSRHPHGAAARAGIRCIALPPLLHEEHQQHAAEWACCLSLHGIQIAISFTYMGWSSAQERLCPASTQLEHCKLANTSQGLFC